MERIVTRLSTALERVADAVEQHAQPTAPRGRGLHDPARKIEASTLMLAIPGIGEILRENFTTVPAERIGLVGDAVAVDCECGRVLTLGFGELLRCSCWRFYFNARTLRVAQPPAPDELVMCDDCDDDLAHKDGAWIRVAGEDRFVCADCHGRASSSGDVDLLEGTR